MRKIHALGALLMLTAWSGNLESANTFTAARFQIGSTAQAEVRWTPNPDRGSASSSMSGGRRGAPFAVCALDHSQPDPAITLLVPDGDLHITTEAQPTLSWFLESDSVVSMEFMLSSPAQPDPIYTKQIQAETGLVEVSLPASAELEPGVAYRWTVFVECDGGDYAIHASSRVERTDDADIVAVAAMPLSERADAYAAKGVWYDALNTLVSAYRQEGEMTTLLDIRDLLKQADAEVPLELSLATES